MKRTPRPKGEAGGAWVWAEYRYRGEWVWLKRREGAEGQPFVYGERQVGIPLRAFGEGPREAESS